MAGLMNKIFVITGMLNFYTRAEIESELQCLGAEVHKKITKDTDYLVVGNRPGSVKMKDALLHNTLKITEKQLQVMLQRERHRAAKADQEQ